MKSKKYILAIVITASSFTPSQSYAKCGSYKACIACVKASVAKWSAASASAFSALHGSIQNLGNTFSSSLMATQEEFVFQGDRTVSALRAASSNITAQVEKNTHIQSQLLDALNEHDEIRGQQFNAMEQKRHTEENYNPETLPVTMLDTFGSQGVNAITSSEYEQFIESFSLGYFDILKSERKGMFSTVVSNGEFAESSKLIWGGEISNTQEMTDVALLTKQVLFSGDTNPFITPGETIDPSMMGRDELKLHEKVSWAARIKPAMEFFAFDQGIRMKPSESKDSLYVWLEDRVNKSFSDPDALVETLSNSSPSDLMRAIAIEQKKRNLISYLDFRTSQLITKMDSTSLSINTDSDQKIARFRANYQDQLSTTGENL